MAERAAMPHRQKSLVIPLLPVIGTFLRRGRKRAYGARAEEKEERSLPSFLPSLLVEFRLNVKRSREIKGGNQGNTRVAISPESERARHVIVKNASRQWAVPRVCRGQQAAVAGVKFYNWAETAS